MKLTTLPKPTNFTKGAWELVSPDIASHVTRLAREAEKWGVKFASDSRTLTDTRTTFTAPVGSTAIRLPGTVLLTEGRQLYEEVDTQVLLHEMCHIVVWKAIRVNPLLQTEFGPEMWLEASTSRRLRLPGRKDWQEKLDVSGNDWRSIGVEPPGFYTWPTISTGYRARFLNKARREAQACGIVDKSGMPTYRLPSQK